MIGPDEDYEDEGMEISPELFDNDFDAIGFDPEEIEDGDDDMAEFFDY